MASGRLPAPCLNTASASAASASPVRARPAFGSATSLDDAKQSFKTAWPAFKAKHWPQALTAAYSAKNRWGREGA